MFVRFKYSERPTAFTKLFYNTNENAILLSFSFNDLFLTRTHTQFIFTTLSYFLHTLHPLLHFSYISVKANWDKLTLIQLTTTKRERKQRKNICTKIHQTFIIHFISKMVIMWHTLLRICFMGIFFFFPVKIRYRYDLWIWVNNICFV